VFQFLIGRLKTEEGVPVFVTQIKFQFLIGRLKTKTELINKHWFFQCFNSL